MAKTVPILVFCVAACMAASIPRAQEGGNTPAEDVRRTAEAVERDSSSAEGWLRHSVALRRAGRLQQAARAAWRVMELGRGETPEAWANIGHVLVVAEEWQPAAECFARARTLGATDSESARHMAALGWQQWKAGETTSALNAYQSAVGFDGDDCALLADFARVSVVAGDRAAVRRIDEAARCAQGPVDAEVRARVSRVLQLCRAGAAAADLDRTPMAPRQRLPERFHQRPRSSALRLETDPHVVRLYRLPDGRSLSARTPEEWSEVFERPRSPEWFRVELAEPGERAFRLRIVAQSAPDSLADLRTRVTNLATLLAERAVERELPVRDVKGGRFSGWMVAYTARDEVVTMRPERVARANGFVRSGGTDVRFEAEGPGDAEEIARKAAGVLWSLDLR